MMFKKIEGDLVYWYYSKEDYDLSCSLPERNHRIMLACVVINTRKNEIIKMRYNLEEFVDDYFVMMEGF